jgi:hypothetical protein
MKRTGWIPANKNPVRPGWYEWRCTNGGTPLGKIVRAEWLGKVWMPACLPTARPRAICPGCQWRGLTKPAKGIAERVKR